VLSLQAEDSLGKSLSLTELRNIGKLIHIKSPTALAKNELVGEILKFSHQNKTIVVGDIWGENSSNIKEKKLLSTLNAQVRKNVEEKIKNGNENFSFKEAFKAESFITDGGDYKVIDTTLFSRAKLSSSVTPYLIVNEQNEVSVPSVNELEQNEGYIDIVDGEWVIKYIGFDERIKLTQEQVNTYKFTRYDNVIFTSFYSKTTMNYLLLDVIKINGLNFVSTEEFIPFEELSVKPPKSVFEFENFSGKFINVLTKITPIAQGSRMLINTENKNAKIKILEELLSAFIKNNTQVFPIFLDCINEEEGFIKKNTPNAVVSGFSDTPEQRMEKLLLAYFRAERYVEMGQNAVIMINDYNALFDSLQALIPIENVNYITNIVTKFFNIGAMRENGGSLSVIAFVNNENLRLKERLKQASSLYVPFKDNEKIYPAIDLVKVQNKLENFYIDEDAKTIASDIKKVVESKDGSKYEPLIKSLANLKNTDREAIVNLIKNL